jgi:hypothetical protein
MSAEFTGIELFVDGGMTKSDKSIRREGSALINFQ